LDRLNILSDYGKQENILASLEEKNLWSQDNLNIEENTYLVSLHGDGIFFNRDIKKSHTGLFPGLTL